jgi:hypothetical protein
MADMENGRFSEKVDRLLTPTAPKLQPNRVKKAHGGLALAGPIPNYARYAEGGKVGKMAKLADRYRRYIKAPETKQRVREVYPEDASEMSYETTSRLLGHAGLDADRVSAEQAQRLVDRFHKRFRTGKAQGGLALAGY